jgi:anthranilate synthase component 1
MPDRNGRPENSDTRILVRLEKMHWVYHEPMLAYQQLAEQFGKNAVYILESMEGPERYSRFGYIGFDPLFRIRFWRRRLELTGSSPLTALIRQRILDSGLVEDTADALHIQDDVQAWAVLRFVSDLFDIRPKLEVEEFSFGWFGYFGYDAIHYIEKLPYRIQDNQPWPDIDLAIYRGVLRYDRKLQTMQVTLAHQASLWPQTPAISYVESLTDTAATLYQEAPSIEPPEVVTDTMEKDAFLDAVETAKEHIRSGDIYQIQVGHAIHIRSNAAPMDVYLRLRARNPSPFMYYAPMGAGFLIGASPELHIRCSNGSVTMRPIAGTAPRGETPAEDEASMHRMRQSEKEIAEHIMLVDLCRNDLARISETGTLCMEDMMIVESYSHVHHLVSTVSARLASRCDVYDVITATFPAGTMTGAPKVRAMEIIEDLEVTRRGPYAGAVGLIDFGGFCELALCIRSTSYHDREFVIRASAGVVFDSVPIREWEETLHKMGATFWAITGEELRHANLAD